MQLQKNIVKMMKICKTSFDSFVFLYSFHMNVHRKNKTRERCMTTNVGLLTKVWPWHLTSSPESLRVTNFSLILYHYVQFEWNSDSNIQNWQNLNWRSVSTAFGLGRGKTLYWIARIFLSVFGEVYIKRKFLTI